MTNGDRSSFLLKQVQPVDRESENAAGRLTDPKLGRRANLRHLTNGVVQYLANRGETRVTDLQRDVNAGAHGLLNLKRALARAKLRLQTFLQIFDDVFVVRNGRVRLKTQAAAAPAAPRRRLTLLGDDAAGAEVMMEMRRIEDEERAAGGR